MNRSVLFLRVGLVLIIANAALYTYLFFSNQYVPHGLKVSILDIGQGDSILIQGPTGGTMLVDGGPDQSVLRKLPEELGPLNRHIDMMVETHPDSDHITGLVSVFDRYQVSNFMEPGVLSDTTVSHALARAADAEPGVHLLVARRGMRIHLGGGAYADVLYPDRDVSHMDTNNGSVVLHVVYGATSFMLTGDLPSPLEDYLVSLDGKDGVLTSDVLKAGHHGSKYSTDDTWLAAVHPATVAISAGKGNPYGHPSPEALGRISKEGAQILSTIDHGTLEFLSDGTKISEKSEK